MSGEFRFETFVDTHSNIFNEYLSSVIAHLSKENEEYKAVQNEIESLYQQYPKVLGVFDTEQAAELTKEECTAVIKVTELKTGLPIWNCSRFTFVVAMTALGISKSRNIVTDKSGIGVKLMLLYIE